MTILIKGVDMPSACDECQLCDDDAMCLALGIDLLGDGEEFEHSWYLPEGYKSEKCPLVSIPTPHGRLIDERWLKEAMITTLESLKKNPKMDKQEMHLIAAFDTLRAMVEDAPTIITADTEEEED